MYDYLKGIITDKITTSSGNYIIIEVNGIGYRIETTETDYTKCPEIENEAKIYTILLHKEDSMSLCGFLTKETRDIFKILISVSGVGSKMGLALLSTFDSCELISLVINEDYKQLTIAKGVGVKLAQKIILELRDKLIKANISKEVTNNSDIHNQATDDTFAVLQSLGYEYEEIKSAMKIVIPKITDINNAEIVLKECLKYLSM